MKSFMSNPVGFIVAMIVVLVLAASYIDIIITVGAIVIIVMAIGWAGKAYLERNKRRRRHEEVELREREYRARRGY